MLTNFKKKFVDFCFNDIDTKSRFRLFVRLKYQPRKGFAAFSTFYNHYDLPWCDTVLDPRLEESIRNFPEKNLPAIYALLDKFKDAKNIVIFKTREEADCFLTMLGEI